MTVSSLRTFRVPVLLLFAASGCAGLIYEIVWYQLLQLAIGSTSVSVGILLATFMGGLAVGSFAFPRLISKQTKPLRIYAGLELGIGVCGLLVLYLMPLVSRAYFAGATAGLAGMLLRGVLAGICMLLPTALMGASLPAMARWARGSQEGVALWGLLYAGNTAGAVFGCLMAGFWLLRIYDTAIATYAAVMVNFVVAAASFWLSRHETIAPEEAAVSEDAAENPWAVYLTIALSGACALGAEVVWTRLLGMLLGATVYVFAIILAVFLIGLALGSAAASFWIRQNLARLRARYALGWCQILLTFGIAWTALMIADSLPYWPIDTFLVRSPWDLFQLDLARCLWAVLPPALFWGASMPLAYAAVSDKKSDSGTLAGRVYAANTIGAIIGALGVSLLLVPAVGTQQSQRVLVTLSALSAIFVLLRAGRTQLILLCLGIAAALGLAWSIDPVPGALIAYGRRLPVYIHNSTIIYTAEGRNSSVAIGRYSDGRTEIDVNGHVEASTEPYDMRLQRMVGHLPALLKNNPKSVLGIGFGAGVSAGTFTRYPSIEHITICEIEPLIPPISTRFFGPENYEVYKNPKTHVVFDDARHYLLTTHDKFDIIASDPLDVFVKGTAALYTKEYFDAVKRHLNPGGTFTLYVPLYESDLATVKSELATFFAAFPYSSVWANNQNGSGYDMVFMGQMEPLYINLDEVQARLNRLDYAPVRESLNSIEISSAVSLFATYTGSNTDLGRWTDGAEINRDRNLKLMYMAGWGINTNKADTIYRDMLRYRTSPFAIFKGSEPMLAQLASAIAFVSGANP